MLYKQQLWEEGAGDAIVGTKTNSICYRFSFNEIFLVQCANHEDAGIKL